MTTRIEGRSDDLVTFDGDVSGEVGCYGGGLGGVTAPYDHGVPRNDSVHVARAEAKRRRKGRYWTERRRWGLGTRNRRVDDK